MSGSTPGNVEVGAVPEEVGGAEDVCVVLVVVVVGIVELVVLGVAAAMVTTYNPLTPGPSTWPVFMLSAILLLGPSVVHTPENPRV